jgi:hypothetical protein
MRKLLSFLQSLLKVSRNVILSLSKGCSPLGAGVVVGDRIGLTATLPFNPTLDVESFLAMLLYI